MKRFKIFLDQGDQFRKRLIKILQPSKSRDYLIVQIGVVL